MAITGADTLSAITDIMDGAATTTGTTATDTITDIHTVTNITIDPAIAAIVIGGDTSATVTAISRTG